MKVDGHRPERRVSQTVMFPLAVSQHPQCILSIVVLDESSSAGSKHKVKVGALIVGEDVAEKVKGLGADIGEQVELSASLYGGGTG